LVEVVPPRIVVSYGEYMREVRYFRTLRERERRAWRLWGYHMARWRWYRLPEDLEALRYWRRQITLIRREYLERRRFFRRKIRRPYWRVQLMRLYYSKPLERTPLFEAEYRVYIFTRSPERWAVFDPKVGEYVKPTRRLWESMNELEFVVSKMAARLHVRWSKNVTWTERFEAIAVDEREVERPLDEEKYYVMIIDEDGVRHVYEDEEIKGWFRTYFRWLLEQERVGRIRRAEAYRFRVRQSTLDEWAKKE